MSAIKRIFSYLINPRSGIWRFSAEDQEIEPRKVPWKGILNPPFILGSLIVIFLVIIVWFGPRFATYDPYITSRSTASYYDVENKTMVRPPFEPNPDHPLGTDRFGNDILSLLLYGARVTIIACLYITAGRVLLGLVLGGISGWTEGSRFDRLVMRLGTVISSFPLLLSSMLMIMALDIQKGVWVFVVSLSILGWTEIGQIVRGEFIRIKEMLYVEAAEALGLTKLQIVVRHALPNVLSYLLSIAFLEMGSVLLITAELGFLGLFVGGGSRFRSDPFSPVIILISEIPEWGALVAQGTPYIRTYPFLVLGPASAFFIAIIGLNAFGEGLRRIFDRWPFSTAFILKKRMLLITAGFIALSAWIFQMTNASVSYQQVAESFDTKSAIARFEELKIYNDIARDTSFSPVMDYTIMKMKEYNIQHGYSEVLASNYFFEGEIDLVKPLDIPVLEVGTRTVFKYQNEFAFLNSGCAGSGSVAGELFFFTGEFSRLNILQRKEIKDNILLTMDEFYNPQIAEKAARYGFDGVLVIKRNQQHLSSEFEVNTGLDAIGCGYEEIPVFQITETAARRITSEAGLSWDTLLKRVIKAEVYEPLGLEGKIELHLSEPQKIFVPNMIGFVGGYDVDNADDILMIYTTFDGLGLSEFGQQSVPEEDLAKIALLLEIMHTWNDNILDPRRSVQFVIWGGEGVEGVSADLIQGLFEKNKLAAKVPTNMNPYVNTNPVKPAFWVEIGDLSNQATELLYGADASPFFVDVFQEASRATDLEITPAPADFAGVDSGLPEVNIWERKAVPGTTFSDPVLYGQKGVLLNRALIQLLRDMQN